MQFGMRGLPVFRPSASLVLHHVPQTMTKDDINKIFADFQPIDNIVFHYITPNVYTKCVTVVLKSIEDAKKFSTKYFNHIIPDTDIKFHYSFRPNDCSLIHQQGEDVIYKQQLDDVPPDFNPYSKNYFISDWSHFSNLQSIPNDSVLINLRYNEIESFDAVFESLTTLNLIGNNLKYMISLTKLPKLENLNISFNLLQHLPAFSKSIVNIDASHNQIVDIDPSLTDAENLSVLNVSHNLIKVVPPIPRRIKQLFLNYNQIEKLDLVSIESNLKEFKIDNNKLKEIPICLKHKFSTSDLKFNSFVNFDLSILLSSVREVNFYKCNLTEFPASAFEMRSLTSLILCGNNIKEIPPEFSNSRIISLDISTNPVSYLPPVPAGMQNLRISHCNISDVCSSIPDTNSLRYFYAVGNKLTKLPKFNRIEELFASGNQITEFPDILSNSTKKKIYLDLSHNKITTIPENLKMDFALFDISYNPLTRVPLGFIGKNTVSCNFCGISDLKMELSEPHMQKISFINIFGTQIKIVPPKKVGQSIVESLSEESDLTDTDICHIECNSSVGFSDTVGKRPTMEDAMVIRQHFALTTIDSPERSEDDQNPQKNETTVKTAIFGLFDGHGGPNVSRWAASTFADLFKLYMEGRLHEDFSESRHDSIQTEDASSRPTADTHTNEKSDTQEATTTTETTATATTTETVTFNSKSENNKNNTNIENINSVDTKSENNTNNTNIENINSVDTKSENNTNNTNIENINSADTKSENNCKPFLFKGRLLDEKAMLDICSYFHNQVVSSNESSGSTMELVIVHSTGTVHISHIGDSKTVVYDSDGAPVFSNVEQRPDLRSEMERLRSEKVRIRRNRTAGILAMSRSLGDVQICGVSHVPTHDVLELRLDRAHVSRNKWLVLACDGVWDDVDVETAGKIVARANDPRKAAAFLRDEGMARASTDNISAIVVDLETLFDE